MIEVVYYARCGNDKSTCRSTKALAEVIATELGVMAEDITVKAGLTDNVFVFLGCGCYGDKSGGKLSEFVAENDFQGRQVALFGTSLTGKSSKLERMAEVLKPAGALIAGSFFCERKALPFLHRGRPTRQEITGARRFAGKMKMS